MRGEGRDPRGRGSVMQSCSIDFMICRLRPPPPRPSPSKRGPDRPAGGGGQKECQPASAINETCMMSCARPQVPSRRSLPPWPAIDPGAEATDTRRRSIISKDHRHAGRPHRRLCLERGQPGGARPLARSGERPRRADRGGAGAGRRGAVADQHAAGGQPGPALPLCRGAQRAVPGGELRDRPAQRAAQPSRKLRVARCHGLYHHRPDRALSAQRLLSRLETGDQSDRRPRRRRSARHPGRSPRRPMPTAS